MAVAAGFSIAESGIKAAQTGLHVTGHNIANSDVEGYSRQRAVQKDLFSQTIGINGKNKLQKGLGADIAHIRRIRDAFIDAVYREETARGELYDVMARTGRDIEDALGELQSPYKAQTVFNDMWDALNELSIFQPGVDTRANFISAAVTFVDRANDVASRFLEAQRNIDGRVRDSVDEINDILADVVKYNSLIMDAEAADENANDFRDSRDAALDRLSGHIGINCKENADGKVDVFCEGAALISNNVGNCVGLKYCADGYYFVEPIVTGGPLNEILPVNAPSSSYARLFNMNGPIDGGDKGRLKGLLASRGFAPAHYATQPVKPVAPEINFTFTFSPPDSALYAWADPRDRIKYDAFRQAWNGFSSNFAAHGADAEKNAAPKPPGIPAFSVIPPGFASDFNDFKSEYDQYAALYSGYATVYDDWALAYRKYENDSFDVNYAILPRAQKRFDAVCNAIMTAINDAVAPYDGAGQKSADAPYGLNGDRYDEIFVRKRAPRFDASGAYVVPDASDRASLYTIGNVLVNPELLNTAGYSKIALSLSGDADDARLVLGLMNEWKGALNVDETYRALVTDIASETKENIEFSDVQEVLTTQINNKRVEISGASLDEEMTKMLKYQHAYIASARVITIIDSMMETIINGFFR
ncbi:MAG: flagellar basal body protein [Clostridiales bacterium]|jgi:flagellar hook-associated protein 1 FlgK|nr:flagellar basal body protein [Clostridiales bacterium]